MAQTFHKFKAESLDQALRAMRKKLGAEAIVVRTATVTEGGILGVFGRQMVEVTASAPKPRPNPRPLTSVEKKYRMSGAAPKGDKQAQDKVAYFEKLIAEAQRRIGSAEGHSTRTRPARGASVNHLAEGNAAVDFAEPLDRPLDRPQPKPASATHDLRNDIRELREMLQVLSAEMPDAQLPAEFMPHYHALLERGVNRNAAAGLVISAAKSGAAKDGGPSGLRDPRIFRERMKMEIRKAIRVTGGIGLAAGTCQVVALVGPTGVGKTTNLAKLAALFAVRERARVGLVTADTYRVAALEQLRTYANIIGLDMKIAHEPKEMAEAIRAYHGYDLVLIDTAGGSPFNNEQMKDVRDLLDAAQPDEVMLLLGASTSLEDLRQVVTRFSCMKPASLLFTKLDETRRFGSLYCLAAEVGLPLSYFSVGQNVPDDVTLAHPGMVAKLVMEGGEKRGRASAKSS